MFVFFLPPVSSPALLICWCCLSRWKLVLLEKTCWRWLLMFLCERVTCAALQRTLPTGSVSCRMVFCWLRRSWQGSSPYTQVGGGSKKSHRSHCICLVFIIIKPWMVSFCQWWSPSATCTAPSPCGERVLSATPGGVSLYPWCKWYNFSHSLTIDWQWLLLFAQA